MIQVTSERKASVPLLSLTLETSAGVRIDKEKLEVLIMG